MNFSYEIWQVIYQYYDTLGNLVIVQGKQGGTSGDVQTIIIPMGNNLINHSFTSITQSVSA